MSRKNYRSETSVKFVKLTKNKVLRTNNAF